VEVVSGLFLNDVWNENMSTQYFRGRPHAWLLMSLLTFTATGCTSFMSGGVLKRSNEQANAGRFDSEDLSTAEQANVCLQTGLRLAAHQKDDHAIAQFTKARSLNPKLKGIAHPLAVLYDRQGRFGLAEQEYQRAMTEGRPSADLLNDFGYFRSVQGNLDDARNLLTQALKLDPNHTQTPVNLAMVHAKSGNYDAAYKLFHQSVGSAAAHQNIGVLLLRDGQEERALAHLQQANAIDPSLQASSTLLAASRADSTGSPIQTVSYEE